jgi:hypothetical protein
MKTRFEIWLELTNEVLKAKWETTYPNLPYEPLTYTKGKKWVKIVRGSSVWGFVSMWDGIYKGSVVKEGDLLKPASWNSPAKHSRGNVFDGTAKFTQYGVAYLS